MIAIKRAIATILAFLNLFFSFATRPGAGDEKKNFRVTSYVVASGVQDESRLHTEDFDIITDVILFGCASFDSAGNVNVQRSVLEKALSNLRNVIGERDVQIHVNLLGPGPLENYADFEEKMKSQGKQHTKAFKSGVLEDNIASLVDEYDFDGVYFDYEYPLNYVNWTPFNQFLVRLDAKLGERILGLAVAEWDIKLSLGSYAAVDRFEVMLYDVYDADGNHATTETVKELSKKLKQYSIPSNKLDLGLPAYARPTDKSEYWYEYAKYFDKLDKDGFYRDERLGKTFWFNRPAEIEEKTRFAIDNEFGGVMMWHYACDLPSSDPSSLLRAVGKTVSSFG